MVKIFENSGYDNNLWGISSDNKCSLSLLKKFNRGDIIWFSTTKGTKYNGKVIAVAEYDNFLDRDKDENKKKNIVMKILDGKAILIGIF